MRESRRFVTPIRAATIPRKPGSTYIMNDDQHKLKYHAPSCMHQSCWCAAQEITYGWNSGLVTQDSVLDDWNESMHAISPVTSIWDIIQIVGKMWQVWFQWQNSQDTCKLNWPRVASGRHTFTMPTCIRIDSNAVVVLSALWWHPWAAIKEPQGEVMGVRSDLHSMGTRSNGIWDGLQSGAWVKCRPKMHYQAGSDVVHGAHVPHWSLSIA